MKRLAAIAATLALAGCIENPGPDANLNQRYNVVEIGPWLSNFNFIVRMVRKDGRIWVETREASPTAFDSVELFIHGEAEDYASHNFFKDGLGAFNFHGIARFSKEQGEAYGSDTDRMPRRMYARNFTATVLRTWGAAGLSGGKYAGKYSGTWTITDSSGARDSAEMVALINNSGELHAGMSPKGRVSPYWMVYASPVGDSAFRLDRMFSYYSDFLLDTLPAKVRTSGDTIRTTFRFEKGTGLDSLEFRFQRVVLPVPILPFLTTAIPSTPG